MTDMNAVERLEAAIAKLETLKAKSTGGEWITDRSGLHSISEEYTYGSVHVGRLEDGEDESLIVTLHRTIDAQLAILYRGLTSVAPEREVAEMLAAAILGGDA